MQSQHTNQSHLRVVIRAYFTLVKYMHSTCFFRISNLKKQHLFKNVVFLFFFVKWMNQIEKWNWFIIIYYLWLLRFSKAYTISNWLHFSQHHVLFSWQFLRLFDVAISYFIYTQKIHRENKKNENEKQHQTRMRFFARAKFVFYIDA